MRNDTTVISGIDWEDAFLNAPYIPNGENFPKPWADRAAAYRTALSSSPDKSMKEVAYGERDRERFDLFHPAAGAKGLVIFVHGGYWLRLDKSYWSYLAEGALSQGWAVAMPSYDLAPDVDVPFITQQIAQAISVAANQVAGPLRLVGHSAGGQLVTRMVCENSPLPKDVRHRIETVMSLSGLHDLRPLMLNSMNDHLALTPESAAAESSALLAPVKDGHNFELRIWVGAQERPEFLRQSALLAEAWSAQGISTALFTASAMHHFNIVDGLEDPSHALCQDLLK